MIFNIDSDVGGARILLQTTREPLGGKFGSDFKLVVNRNSSSHFLFLELSQLKWLEGVTKVAKETSWRFPRSCFVESARRRIVIAKPEPEGLSSKSFAEVVSQKGLGQKGNCVVEKDEDGTRSLVAKVGIEDGLKYLQRCAVFRLIGGGEVDWPEFRIWISRNWGLPKNSSFSLLGDGLWLVECSSAKEVNRAVSLGRWRFQGFTILLDVWIKEAGRSSVLLDFDVAWVVVRGIPLHLRSTELFRSLGEACGGFVSHSGGADLSLIRIKIKLRGAVPAEIPLVAGSNIFPVKVDLEEISPIPAPVLDRKGKNKVPGVKIGGMRAPELQSERRLSGRRWSPIRGESSASPNVSEPAVSSLSVTVTEVGRQEGGQSIIGFQDSFFSTVERNFQKPGTEGKIDVSGKKFPFLGFRLSQEGLFLGSSRVSLVDFGLIRLSQPRPVWVNLTPNGLGPFLRWNSQEAFWTSENLGAQFNAFEPISLPSDQSVTCSSGRRGGNVSGLLSPVSEFHSQRVALEGVISSDPGGVEVRFGVDSSTPHVEELSEPEVSSDKLLCDAVRKVAEVIALEAKGSLSQGVEEALGVYREIGKRKSAASLLSSQEREWRRLGISQEEASNALNQKR
ncbi:hypothetical protein LINPERHAP1_LOCUS6740, partial [Linum perenne]